MSKLDGNERWKSKMLLTEHQEQYEERKIKPPTHRQSSEEYTMVRDYILLPHMLTMVQKSIDDVRNSSNLLKRLYVTAAQVVMDRISKDLYALRREMSRRNIKVFEDEQADLVVYHRFVCRGYEDRFGMTRDVMRSEISLRLSRYIKELTDSIGKR